MLLKERVKSSFAADDDCVGGWECNGDNFGEEDDRDDDK